MSTKNLATEQSTLADAQARLPEVQAHLDKILARLNRVQPLPADARFLDIGAAQGLVLIAGVRRGMQGVGVEPWEPARRVAQELAAQQGVEIAMTPGVAEDLPLPSGSFDLVHANSVIEHVNDPQAMMDEVYRVLRPRGVFWFSAASSMCPAQEEISGFPFFGWYPDRLKRRIMAWAKRRRPDLVGHTEAPAVNWFTTRKARAMLRRAGFRRIYDRWDLRLPAEGGWVHRVGLGLIRLTPINRLVADTLVSACSYAAVKGGVVPVTDEPRFVVPARRSPCRPDLQPVG